MVTRAQLKQYFETGDVPTQSQFAALIDEMRLGSEEVPVAEVTGAVAYNVAQVLGTSQCQQALSNIKALGSVPQPDLTDLEKATMRSNAGAVAESLRDQNNGFVGIGPSGEIIGTFASRVATQAALSSIVLKNGELAFASDSKDTFRGNGTTPGGLLVAGGRSITANFTVSTSSTALGTVISFPVVAGAVHRIKALLKFASAAATGNFQFQLNGTDGYSSGNMAGSLVSASHVINWRDPAGTLFSQSDVLLLPASSLAFLCPFTTVTSSICELEYTFTPGANGVMNLLVGQKTTDPTPSACQWVCEAERLR